jgi:cell division protein FtsB
VKLIVLILILLLVWLQYKLWLDEGGVPEVLKLESEVDAMQREVEVLKERNNALDAEVKDLKQGLEAIEERARSDMGMIRQGEVYYQVIEDQPASDEAPRDDSRDP